MLLITTTLDIFVSSRDGFLFLRNLTTFRPLGKSNVLNTATQVSPYSYRSTSINEMPLTYSNRNQKAQSNSLYRIVRGYAILSSTLYRERSNSPSRARSAPAHWDVARLACSSPCGPSRQEYVLGASEPGFN